MLSKHDALVLNELMGKLKLMVATINKTSNDLNLNVSSSQSQKLKPFF